MRFVRINLFILAVLCSATVKSAPLAVNDRLLNSSSAGLESRYGEQLATGIVSNDGLYYQKGGDVNNLQAIIDDYRINIIRLENVSGLRPVVLSVDDELKTITIDGSHFHQDFKIELNGLQYLTIRDNTFVGNVSIMDSEKQKKFEIFLKANVFNAKTGEDPGLFSLETIYGKELKLFDNTFFIEANIFDVDLTEESWFKNNKFKDGFTLIANEFNSEFLFQYNVVGNQALFPKVIFTKFVSFKNTVFEDKTDFSNTVFEEKPIFPRTRFKGVVDFSGVKFLKGVDLRIAKFGENKGIKLEAFEADMNEFYIDFSQIEKTGLVFIDPKENLENDKEKEQEELARLNNVYEPIIAQYKKRGLSSNADDLALMQRREENNIKHSFIDYMYDFYMGYGYQTWRYILFVVFPALLFFGLFYLYAFKDEIDRVVKRKDQIPVDETLPSHLLVRSARMITMSASILFAIRYKTIWISENNKFNKLVMVNYLFGIGLYLMFALGTRVSSFDIVKSFIGI